MDNNIFALAVNVLLEKGYRVEASQSDKTLRMFDANGRIIIDVVKEDFEVIIEAVKQIPGIGGFVGLMGEI